MTAPRPSREDVERAFKSIDEGQVAAEFARDREERNAAVAAERERLAGEVPNSWLDPLLTGPDAALDGTRPMGCQDVERLLRGVRDRLRASRPPESEEAERG